MYPDFCATRHDGSCRANQADAGADVIYTTTVIAEAGVPSASRLAYRGPEACTFSRPLADLRLSAEPIEREVRHITWLGRRTARAARP